MKAGDSVWSVSNKYGITMAQLIQWNNIQNNFIYPGQQLTVSNYFVPEAVLEELELDEFEPLVLPVFAPVLEEPPFDTISCCPG